MVAQIGKGDRVVTSANTFLSSANCAAFVGATPDFCDVDPATYTMCADALEAMWTDDIKAVIPVAYAGQSADMPRIAETARARGAVIIEDACHGTGGGFEVDGKAYRQGDHPWADMTTFSFHPVKTLTTGEGGMLVTDNDDYAAQARLLRTHGMTREPGDFSGLGSDTTALAERGPWYYENAGIGLQLSHYRHAVRSRDEPVKPTARIYPKTQRNRCPLQRRTGWYRMDQNTRSKTRTRSVTRIMASLHLHSSTMRLLEKPVVKS